MNRLFNPFVIVLLLFVAGGVGYVISEGEQVYSQKGSVLSVQENMSLTPTEDQQTSPTPTPNPFGLSDKDHTRGNLSEAQVAIIKYADFECPFCKRLHPVLDQVRTDYGGDIVWVFRHFPLEGYHKQALEEAEASECVAKLAGNDAFWIYADKIYANTQGNDTLDLSLLSQFAEELGVSREDYSTCMNTDVTIPLIREDQRTGQVYGVSGTPHTIVTNLKTGAFRHVSGAVPYETIQSAIDSVQ